MHSALRKCRSWIRRQQCVKIHRGCSSLALQTTWLISLGPQADQRIGHVSVLQETLPQTFRFGGAKRSIERERTLTLPRTQLPRLYLRVQRFKQDLLKYPVICEVNPNDTVCWDTPTNVKAAIAHLQSCCAFSGFPSKGMYAWRYALADRHKRLNVDPEITRYVFKP